MAEITREAMAMTVVTGNVNEVEQTNVKVMVRVRPFLSREIALTEGGVSKLRSIVVLEEGMRVRLLDPACGYVEKEAFEFDHAFWSVPESQIPFSGNKFVDQGELFHYIGKPCVANALRGFHNTIFAYGQTGSGKTYSLLGGNETSDEGVGPRLVRYLFLEIERLKMETQFDRIEFKVELSFLEIYNERVKDLLLIAERGGKRSNQSDTGYAECKVRYHPEKGTFVEGLTRLHIEEEDQCLTAIREGMEHRAVASTKMNDASSRSHGVFQLIVTQKMPLKGASRVSIMNIVDLAGSERINMSGVTGSALKEAIKINLSLSTLRRVIDVLIENANLRKGERAKVPPFRESILTHILQDALGGNSKTMMLSAVSPFGGNYEDTANSLRYALKARAIVCNARVNEERAQAVVNSLHMEMEKLRQKLAAKAIEDEVERERIITDLKNTEEMYHQMEDEARELDELKVKYEVEIKEKEKELVHAETEIKKYEHVEQERIKRAEELEAARQVKTEAEETLKKQEEEVLKRENELAEVMSRQKELQMHHDKAAAEEVKVKKLAEHARLRQFASAFRNAFIRGKQRSGLEALQEQYNSLRESVEKNELECTSKELILSELLTEKLTNERRMGVAPRHAAQLFEQVKIVIASNENGLPEALKERNAALAELHLAYAQLRQADGRLSHSKGLRELEKTQLEKEITSVELEIERIKQLCGRFQKRKSDLDEQARSAAGELAALKHQYTKTSKQLEELQAENQKKEEYICELYQERATLLAKRKQIKAKMMRHRDNLNARLSKLQGISGELKELRNNHAQLRAFVDGRFFPLPQCSYVEDGCGYYNPGSTDA